MLGYSPSRQWVAEAFAHVAGGADSLSGAELVAMLRVGAVCRGGRVCVWGGGGLRGVGWRWVGGCGAVACEWVLGCALAPPLHLLHCAPVYTTPHQFTTAFTTLRDTPLHRKRIPPMIHGTLKL